MRLSRFWNGILDLLFPPRCVSCSSDEDWWCAECRSNVERVYTEVVFEDLDGMCVLGYYHDPILRAAIQGLKFHGMSVLRPSIESFIASRGLGGGIPEHEPLAIQALPTSPTRKRARGFDQAELLMELLHDSGFADFYAVDLLVRGEGSGMAQARLPDPKLRLANVADVFRLKLGAVPEAVLLVDDVITSGATMCEAARLLRAHGAKHVYGFALALGA